MSAAEHRAPFPPSIPPEINHVVLTGRLSADPQEGRSPSGEPIKLLRVEFPVIDPDRTQSLWRCANCLVEVPVGRSGRDVAELRGGSPVLAAGQISDRWTIEGGHTSRSGVIVAAQVKAGPPEIPERLLL
jgi:single-stranded DNA-binding protein